MSKSQAMLALVALLPAVADADQGMRPLWELGAGVAASPVLPSSTLSTEA
jgi:hypothetical protein